MLNNSNGRQNEEKINISSFQNHLILFSNPNKSKFTKRCITRTSNETFQIYYNKFIL